MSRPVSYSNEPLRLAGSLWRTRISGDMVQPDWARLGDVVLLQPEPGSRTATAGDSDSDSTRSQSPKSEGVPFRSLVPDGRSAYAKTLLVFVRNFA